MGLQLNHSPARQVSSTIPPSISRDSPVHQSSARCLAANACAWWARPVALRRSI